MPLGVVPPLGRRYWMVKESKPSKSSERSQEAAEHRDVNRSFDCPWKSGKNSSVYEKFKPLNNLQVNETSSNKMKPHTGCKHPLHSLPPRSISKLQLSLKHRMKDSVPDSSLAPWLPDSENNAQREGARPGEAGRRYRRCSQSVSAHSPQRQMQNRQLLGSCPWGDYEKTKILGLPQVMTSPRHEHSVYSHLLPSAVSWKKKVVLWGQTKASRRVSGPWLTR